MTDTYYLVTYTGWFLGGPIAGSLGPGQSGEWVEGMSLGNSWWSLAPVVRSAWIAQYEGKEKWFKEKRQF